RLLSLLVGGGLLAQSFKDLGTTQVTGRRGHAEAIRASEQRDPLMQCLWLRFPARGKGDHPRQDDEHLIAVGDGTLNLVGVEEMGIEVRGTVAVQLHAQEVEGLK